MPFKVDIPEGMRHLILAALLLFSVPATSAPVGLSSLHSKIYVVVFKVAVNDAGGIFDLQIDRVIDPDGSGTPEERADRPVQLAVPSAYINSARAFLEKLYRNQRAAHNRVFYTFTFFDPARPAEIVAGPK